MYISSPLMNGVRTNNKIIEYVLSTTNKRLLYTYGLSYRQPTTYKKPISNTEAMNIFKKGGLLDVTEFDDYIHLNEYSANDMW